MPGLSWWVAFSTADKGSQLRDGTPHDSPHLCIAGSNVNTYNLDALAFPSHFAHMQLGPFLKNQNGNLIDNKLLCIPGQGKATSLRRSILNNYSKCMHCCCACTTVSKSVSCKSLRTHSQNENKSISWT